MTLPPEGLPGAGAPVEEAKLPTGTLTPDARVAAGGRRRARKADAAPAAGGRRRAKKDKSTLKPTAEAAELPAAPTITAELPAEAAELPAEAAKPTAAPTITAELPAEAAITAELPAEAVELPAAPTITAELPAAPAITAELPAKAAEPLAVRAETLPEPEAELPTPDALPGQTLAQTRAMIDQQRALLTRQAEGIANLAREQEEVRGKGAREFLKRLALQDDLSREVGAQRRILLQAQRQYDRDARELRNFQQRHPDTIDNRQTAQEYATLQARIKAAADADQTISARDVLAFAMHDGARLTTEQTDQARQLTTLEERVTRSHLFLEGDPAVARVHVRRLTESQKSTLKENGFTLDVDGYVMKPDGSYVVPTAPAPEDGDSYTPEDRARKFGARPAMEQVNARAREVKRRQAALDSQLLPKQRELLATVQALDAVGNLLDVYDAEYVQTAARAASQARNFERRSQRAVNLTANLADWQVNVPAEIKRRAGLTAMTPDQMATMARALRTAEDMMAATAAAYQDLANMATDPARIVEVMTSDRQMDALAQPFKDMVSWIASGQDIDATQLTGPERVYHKIAQTLLGERTVHPAPKVISEEKMPAASAAPAPERVAPAAVTATTAPERPQSAIPAFRRRERGKSEPAAPAVSGPKASLETPILTASTPEAILRAMINDDSFQTDRYVDTIGKALSEADYQTARVQLVGPNNLMDQLYNSLYDKSVPGNNPTRVADFLATRLTADIDALGQRGVNLTQPQLLHTMARILEQHYDATVTGIQDLYRVKRPDEKAIKTQAKLRTFLAEFITGIGELDGRK